MKEDIAPFKLHYKDDRLRLRLHGTNEQRIVVEKDKVHIILDAIPEGLDIDIEYVIIEGDLDINKAHLLDLNKYDKGRLIINGNIIISRSNINGTLAFNLCTFNCSVTFEEVEFNDRVEFFSAVFSTVASFQKSTFNGNADFISSIFNGNALFNGTTFNIVRFNSSVFNSYAYFNTAVFLTTAEFDHSYFWKSASFIEANFDNIPAKSFDNIGDVYVRSLNRGAHYFFNRAGDGHFSNADHSEASDSFRNAKVEYEKEGIYDKASRMYINEKDSIRLDMKIKKSSPTRRAWLTAWKYTSNYGENPLWFIGWVVAIVLFFAIIYMPIMPDWWLSITFKEYPYHDWNSGIVDGTLFNIVTAIYFSIVTFATLGFGDISPISITGKIATISEVLLGYAIFGILITMVARKMTRH